MPDDARIDQALRAVHLAISDVRDALHHLKDLDRAGEAQADEVHRAEDRVQKLTDEHVHEIDELLKRKEAEIMEV